MMIIFQNLSLLCISAYIHIVLLFYIYYMTVSMKASLTTLGYICIGDVWAIFTGLSGFIVLLYSAFL